MFALAHHHLEVTRAELVPFVSSDATHVVWGVELAAELGDWQPELTADRLVTTRMGTIRHWQEIAPSHGRWTRPSASPEASLYIHEHSPVYDCTWELLRAGAGVSLRLEGRVDVADEPGPLGRSVAVHIELPLQIAPWPFGKVSERECRAAYAKTGLEDAVDFRDVRGVAHLVLRGGR